MLKTYGKDLKLATRLICSFNKHNVENLKFFIVIPEIDKVEFNIFQNENIHILSEESLNLPLTKTPVLGIRPGYINQQIVKLGFWESKLTENYMCIDADGEFIRDFYLHDFMANEHWPYTVLVEDLDLQADSQYYKEHWISRDNALIKIINFLKFTPGRNYKTCHNFNIFNYNVLRSLKSDIIEPNKYTYIDLLQIAPYEFSWYNFYLQSKNFPIFSTEPYFKMIHNNPQLLQSQIIGMKREDYARSYIGIVVNSNFRSTLDQISLDENFQLLVSRLLKFKDLFKIIHYKILYTILKKKNIAKHYIKKIILFWQKNL